MNIQNIEAGDYVIDAAGDTCLIVELVGKKRNSPVIRWFSRHEPVGIEQMDVGTGWRYGIQRMARPEEIAVAKLEGVV